MKCPVDESVLVMSERSGIEIDYCPQCRGVWLDRGELDKIVDRAAADVPAAAPPAPAAPAYGQSHGASHHDQPRYDRQPQGYQQPYRRKKKENWLSDLFD